MGTRIRMGVVITLVVETDMPAADLVQQVVDLLDNGVVQDALEEAVRDAGYTFKSTEASVVQSHRDHGSVGDDDDELVDTGDSEDHDGAGF